MSNKTANKTMSSDMFKHEMSKTSKVFGRRDNLQVVFQGQKAGTNGSTVILPSIAHDTVLTDEQTSIMRGFVDHEAGHVRHSNFDVLNRIDAECEQSKNNLLKNLVNAVEDIRLEAKVLDDYPGARKNIRATAGVVNRKFMEKVPAGDARLADPKFVSPIAITWAGRTGVTETAKEALDRLPAELRDRVTIYAQAIKKCDDTTDAVCLARAIEREIREGKMLEDQGDYMDPSKAFEKGKGEGAGGGDDRKGGRGDGPGETPSGRGHHGASAPAHFNDDTYSEFDPGAAFDDTTLPNHAAKGKYKPFSTMYDRVHHRTDARDKYKCPLQSINLSYGSSILARGTTKMYNDAVEQMSGHVNTIRRKLERALLAKQARDWDFGKYMGRLDNRRLVQAFGGKENVFKARQDRKEMDTAVTLLVDCSGSMSGRKIQTARECTMAICEAIDKTGVAYEVIGFTNDDDYIFKGHEDRKNFSLSDLIHSGGYTRAEPFEFYIFKTFDERLKDAKGAISMIDKVKLGNNADGEAVAFAHARLASRNEKRKIFICLSDGYPSCYTEDDAALRADLRNAVNRVEKDGIDCIGIGIKSEAVRHFYPKYVVVNSIEDLSGKAMDMLAKALLGERFKVDNRDLLKAS